MIDFLIFYEHKVREYDSVKLLKMALERKGYSVAVEKTAELSYLKYLRKKNKPKVIVTYSLYNDASLITQVLSVAWNVKKVVNLQWEQIISDDPKVAAQKIPSETAVNAVHMCWGDKIRDRLRECGIKKAVTIGAIHLDFLREGFKSFYLNREELEEQFHLPKGRMILYISTFRLDLKPKELQVLIEKKGEDYIKFYDDMSRSRKITLEWLDVLAEKNPDTYIVYRPHPAENQDEELRKRIDRGRFFVIQDKSIKQWILTADQIYTWMSTSIVEVYFAKKNCQILRPLSVNKKYDATIFKDANIITDKNQLIASFGEEMQEFPIDSKTIESYYYSSGVYAYQKAVDLLEKVHSSKEYEIKRYPAKLYLKAIKMILIRMVKKSITVLKITSKTPWVRGIKKISKWLDFFYYYQEKERYEIVSKQDDISIEVKLKDIIRCIEG